MSLIAPQLESVLENFNKNAPDAIKNPILSARQSLTNFDTSNSIKPGTKLPSFTLPNATGQTISSNTLLSQGPLIITFYRGEWCPFCNIALSSFQIIIPVLKEKGVSLVAITPELPNGTLSVTEKHALEFNVLTDEHNEFARKLGIVWKQPESMRPVFEKFGHDLPKRNGDDSFELPLPMTMLVDTEGVVREVYLEPDYTKRVEPKTVLGWVEKLQQQES